MRYGFIGLGAMGQRMAQNIASKMKSGDSLSVFDLVASRATMGTVRGSPAEVVANSDTIITSLPEGAHVKSVFQQLRLPNKMYLDCSTIDVKTSRYVAELVEQSGSKYIDTPVSGGTVGAEQGTLTFMVGAEANEPVRRTLEMMGRKIFFCGAQSTGLAAKLANNYILALNNLATSEGFALAHELGLDMSTFSEIVNVSSGQSWSTTVNNPVPGVNLGTPSSRDYEGGFAVRLMLKDLNLALASAKSTLEMGFKAPKVYQGLPQDRDFSVYYSQLVNNK